MSIIHTQYIKILSIQSWVYPASYCVSCELLCIEP